MREISPAENCSPEEFYSLLSEPHRNLVDKIRREKVAGSRPNPSRSLLDISDIRDARFRCELIDQVASLVDENLCGRSDMCQQFAELLAKALSEVGFAADPISGTATYLDNSGSELFRWSHCWVRVGPEVVDGNTDCFFENPAIPSTVRISPYWGPILQTPSDRKLRAETSKRNFPRDHDVDSIWWPELRNWLEQRS